MIVFEKVSIKDKQWIDPLLKKADMRGSHYNFTNIFAWASVYAHHVASVYDHLLVRINGEDKKKHYFYPSGKENLKLVLGLMMADAENNGWDFSLIGLLSEQVKELNDVFPKHFTISTNRDLDDYIYLLSDLVNLSGKKLQAKRNHINRFKREYSWSVEPITTKNLYECWDMNKKWCETHDCADDEMLSREKCAVELCFENFSELDLEGMLLRVSGKVIAFTMGEVQNSDTYIVHIEKAFSDYNGAYQVINNEFARFVFAKYPHIQFVNREEDMGYDGLRKAKLSYHPAQMEVKYLAETIPKQLVSI